jgi:hypothetical protein
MNIGKESEAIYVEPIEMPGDDQAEVVETQETERVPVLAEAREAARPAARV